MSDTKYTYAVARIRALEVSLFSDAFIEQLLACRNADQVLQSVIEKGCGMDAGNDAEAVLKCEEEKAWAVIRDVAPDMRVFDVLSYPKLYHNLKAAVKEVYAGMKNPAMFYDDCPIPGEEMYRIVENRDFSRLPGNMGRTAQEALDLLLHTGDGQLCDIMIDRYADTTVAIADIKIAVRSQKTGKDADFMRNAMAECESISRDQLIRAALSGAEEIARYLEGTSYAGGAESLRESPSAFERWCDNRMIETLKSQKYETFSVGPLLAYLVARETEIRTVRIILTGKQNGFSDDAIRERIREMYV